MTLHPQSVAALELWSQGPSVSDPGFGADGIAAMRRDALAAAAVEEKEPVDRVEDVDESVWTVRQRFHDAEHFADLFISDYGPTHQVALKLDPDAREAFRQDLVDLAASSNVATDGTLATDWDYLVVTARRR